VEEQGGDDANAADRATTLPTTTSSTASKSSGPVVSVKTEDSSEEKMLSPSPTSMPRLRSTSERRQNRVAQEWFVKNWRSGTPERYFCDMGRLVH